jgi:hypothetical protein
MLRAMPDELDEELKQIQRSKVNGVLPGVGLAIGLLPFFLSFRETRESSFVMSADGAQISQTTHKMAFDYIAVPFGALAIVLGLVGLLRGLPARKLGVLGAGVAAMALGLLQVVRGFL